MKLTERWPTIITGIISTLTNVVHELHGDESADAKAELEEGKVIISKLSAIKHEMGRNIDLPCVNNFCSPLIY